MFCASCLSRLSMAFICFSGLAGLIGVIGHVHAQSNTLLVKDSSIPLNGDSAQNSWETITNSFREKMETHRKDRLAMTNRLLEDLVSDYVSASSDQETERIQSKMFSTLHEATIETGDYPGVMTPELAVIKFRRTVRQAMIERLMVRMDVRSLFALGDNFHASIEVPVATSEMMQRNQVPIEKSSMPLSLDERRALQDRALQRQKQVLEFHENSRKLQEMQMRAEKASVERRFVDAVLRSNGVNSEVHLKLLQDLKRSDGSPAFDGTEIRRWSDFIDTVQQNAQKSERVPDPKVLSKYWDQIERAIRARGINQSTYQLPSVEAIEEDLNLTRAWRDILINAIKREQAARMQDWSSEDTSNSAPRSKK